MNNNHRTAKKHLLGTKHDRIILAVILVIALAVGAFTLIFPDKAQVIFENIGLVPKEIEEDQISALSEAEFHFIDVGQGDSALIITDEVHILVDCGTYEHNAYLTEYISQYTDKIDMFVFSHAHDDHMGGAAAIINSFEVSEILMTEYDTDSAFYGRALDAIEDNDVDVTEAIAGNTYTCGDVTIEVFSPMKDYNDLNNNSIVMRVEVDGASVMFTGDAESSAEADVVAKYGDRLKSNILKVGHHGSSTSTTEDFLNAVDPEFAVVSCGNGNSYGHPHREIRERFDMADFDWYRTDEDGTVVIACSNGELKYKE